MGETRVLVGVVGAPQGVRGELRLKSYTGVPRDIGAYGPLQSEDGSRTVVVQSLRPLKGDMLVARIEGVNDRDSAAALTNIRLYVDRARLPPPDPDEFYHTDLIGLRAEGEDGVVVGRVKGIENHGAGDILEVVPQAGGETLLIPFTLAFVPTIDFETGRLVVAAGALIPEDEGDATYEGS